MIDHGQLAQELADYLNEEILIVEAEHVSRLTMLDALASVGLCLVPDNRAASQSYVEELTA